MENNNSTLGQWILVAGQILFTISIIGILAGIAFTLDILNICFCSLVMSLIIMHISEYINIRNEIKLTQRPKEQEGSDNQKP